MIFLPYTWRGKSYKTVTGLGRAIFKAYPGAGYTFGESEMHINVRSTRTLYVFDVARTESVNEICDQPKRTVQS